jgi:REP element-mobilizing transposase RayT
MVRYRKITRLAEFDYRTNGAYFLTVCAHFKRFLFGQVHDGSVIPTPLGRIIESEWKDLPGHYDYVVCDESLVMPNHFHGIIFLLQLEDAPSGTMTRGAHTASCVTTKSFGRVDAGSLSAIVRSFKGGVTRRARRELGIVEPVWQPNFYEHVIRNDKDLYNIRKYIQENPLKWELDKENPQHR